MVERTSDPGMMRVSNIAEFPFKVIMIALVVAIVLALLFAWVRHYVVPMVKDRNMSRLLDTWLPRFEIIVWTAFSIFLLTALLQAELLITAGFVVLIGIAGWAIWKDLFIGLYFRIVARFLPGDPFAMEEISGTVVRSGIRDLELALNDGGKAWIPYSKLASNVIKKRTAVTEPQRRSFKISLAGAEDSQAEQRIRALLMRDPWVASARPISVTPEVEGKYKVDLHLVDPQVLDRVVSALKKAIKVADLQG